MKLNKDELQNLRLQFENFKFKENNDTCLIYFPWGLTNQQNDFSIMIKPKSDRDPKIVVTDQGSSLKSLGTELTDNNKQAIVDKITEIAHYYHLKTKVDKGNFCVYQSTHQWSHLNDILYSFYTYGIAVKEFYQTIPLK